MTYLERLNRSIERHQSLLCVGLDPDAAKLPAHLGHGPEAVVEFCRAIIDATADLVAVYKPNYAFFGALGGAGWDVLHRVLDSVPADVPVILDAKVGDIGNTAEQYARMFFGELGADALTVNPYMGTDAVEPFVRRADRGVYLLCLTSNPGAADFEELDTGGAPLFARVAAQAVAWNRHGNVGLVVGATQAERIGRVRALAPGLPFLVPGVGAQGGDLQAAVTQARDQDGRGLVLNASRAVLFASGGTDYAAAARRAADELRQQINQYR